MIMKFFKDIVGVKAKVSCVQYTCAQHHRIIHSLFLLFRCYRYIMVVKVSDPSGEAWVSTFNEEAEHIIGCPADELNELKSQVSQEQILKGLKRSTSHIYAIADTDS